VSEDGARWNSPGHRLVCLAENPALAVLRVLGIIVQDARNLPLKPAHPRAAETRVLACTRFLFDERLWGGV
jgi:RES domain-containing protein